MRATATHAPIYLNAASHGLPDARVRERMKEHLLRERDVGTDRAAAEAAAETAEVRGKAAALLGGRPDEIAFLPATTLAWGLAVAALPLRGRRVLVASNEWASNVATLSRLAKTRHMALQPLPVDPEGGVDTGALAELLDDDVAAICVPMVSSLTGRRYPVEEIGGLPRPEGCFYIVDAAQALGQMQVSVSDIGCDMLAATARKWLRAPRATALLHVSRATLEVMDPQPFPDSGALVWQPQSGAFADAESAARFESFDFNVALRLGLGAAIEVVREAGVRSIERRIAVLARHAAGRGAEAGLALFGVGEPQSGIVSFQIPGHRAPAVERSLAAAGIAAKFPQLWNEPFLAPPRDGRALVRIAPHVYNSKADINAAFDAIERCLTDLVA